MTVVLGIDVGRRLGWGVIDYDTGDYIAAGTTTIGPGPRPSITRKDDLAQRRAVEAWEAEFVANTAAVVADLARLWEPTEVGVEAPFIHARHVTGSVTLLKQHGAVLVALWRQGHAPAMVAPSSLKLAATGSGRADKAAMGLAAAARWGTAVFGLGHDAIDALWVASWARNDALSLRGDA